MARRDSLFTDNYRTLQAHERLALANTLLRQVMSDNDYGELDWPFRSVELLEHIHAIERMQNDIGRMLEQDIYAPTPRAAPDTEGGGGQA